MQPLEEKQSFDGATAFKIADHEDFVRLVQRHPEGAFTEKDLQLLPSLYPGQSMPEGMQWGLKQIGNLHILDYIKIWGLVDILEMGPGFNFYFPNHLPACCAYTGIDKEGFYDSGILLQAETVQGRCNMVRGLLGKEDHQRFNPAAFDACISVSVLEHVEDNDIDALCKEMHEVLRPGGWALHSIDLPIGAVETKGASWLQAIRKAGFQVADASISLEPNVIEKIFYEPLSIVMTFYGGYKSTIWSGDPGMAPVHYVTILVAARKTKEV